MITSTAPHCLWSFTSDAHPSYKYRPFAPFLFRHFWGPAHLFRIPLSNKPPNQWFIILFSITAAHPSFILFQRKDTPSILPPESLSGEGHQIPNSPGSLSFPILWGLVPLSFSTEGRSIHFSFQSLCLYWPLVMTPSRRTMLAWSNCPRIPASLRKERLCFSEQPERRVFMATGSSRLLGSFRQPRHTSPKSPAGHKCALDVSE